MCSPVQAVAKIEQNPVIATYAEEFYKLFQVLRESNVTKKELIDKCLQLEKQLSKSTEKLIAATKAVQEDAEVIQSLKEKINNSWKITDAAHEREQQAQEIIDNLRNQIHALTVELDFKSKMASDSDDGGAANKNQERLEREKQKLLSEVAQLQQKLANALGYQEELERKNSQADFKIVNLSAELEKLRADFDEVKKQRDKLESDTIDINTELNKCSNEIKFLQNTLHQRENLTGLLDKQISDLKYTKERLLKDLDERNQKHRQLQENYKELTENNGETTKQLAKSALQIKFQEDQNRNMQAKMDKPSCPH
ncbi:hypothetical protein RN001_011689 [Aquatica leii]|uniref:Uncharacterized protein n=1 Tax=Aquatica leii TaxID=1421715 RepID=A0AAN7SCY3_9COLE|nr:hypothetical protein RN001_011689 [Aquatica leii]